MDKEKVCQNANAILDRLTYANTSLNVFESIITVYNGQEQELLLPDINFWRVVLDNCIFRALVELAKTYDEGEGSIGLKKLINQVEQIKPENTTKKLIKEAREKYAAENVAREKLKTLRDKGLVHADRQYASDLNQLLSTCELSQKEIESLLLTAYMICNDILVEFTGTGKAIAVSLCDDASGVLEDVRIAREVRKKRRAGIMV